MIDYFIMYSCTLNNDMISFKTIDWIYIIVSCSLLELHPLFTSIKYDRLYDIISCALYAYLHSSLG